MSKMVEKNSNYLFGSHIKSIKTTTTSKVFIKILNSS